MGFPISDNLRPAVDASAINNPNDTVATIAGLAQQGSIVAQPPGRPPFSLNPGGERPLVNFSPSMPARFLVYLLHYMNPQDKVVWNNQSGVVNCFHDDFLEVVMQSPKKTEFTWIPFANIRAVTHDPQGNSWTLLVG